MIKIKNFFTDNDNILDAEKQLNFFIKDEVEEVISINTTFGNIQKPYKNYFVDSLITTLTYKPKNIPLINFELLKYENDNIVKKIIYGIKLYDIPFMKNYQIVVNLFPTSDLFMEKTYTLYINTTSLAAKCNSFTEAIEVCKEHIFKNFYNEIMKIEEQK